MSATGGRNVMTGAFLATCNLGSKAADTSLVRITGRLKELIITNVAPVPIEYHLLAICPALNHCVSSATRASSLYIL